MLHEKWRKMQLFDDFRGGLEENVYFCSMDQKLDIKLMLIDKLKQEHCLWSYENDSIQDIPDDVLVELVMLYLDIDEINLLFQLFDYKKVKQAWIENVVAQGERYYNLNYFFAWYYFHAKQPRRYVKAMATRQLNKRLAA